MRVPMLRARPSFFQSVNPSKNGLIKHSLQGLLREPFPYASRLLDLTKNAHVMVASTFTPLHCPEAQRFQNMMLAYMKLVTGAVKFRQFLIFPTHARSARVNAMRHSLW